MKKIIIWGQILLLTFDSDFAQSNRVFKRPSMNVLESGWIVKR